MTDANSVFFIHSSFLTVDDSEIHGKFGMRPQPGRIKFDCDYTFAAMKVKPNLCGPPASRLPNAGDCVKATP
jgi:hypothetical protein